VLNILGTVTAIGSDGLTYSVAVSGSAVSFAKPDGSGRDWVGIGLGGPTEMGTQIDSSYRGPFAIIQFETRGMVSATAEITSGPNLTFGQVLSGTKLYYQNAAKVTLVRTPDR
jgi:hypothetical protein